MKKFTFNNIIKEAQLDAFSQVGGADKFDWEEQDDSDLNGPSIEIAIDDLIADVEELLQKEFPADVRKRKLARLAVKKLWARKIKEWHDRNIGQGIPGEN